LAWEPGSNLIFGGSGNYGGGGTRPTEKEARFFAFDLKKEQKVFETALVPGAANYPATFAGKGKVFTTMGDKLFVLDPSSFKVTQTIQLPGAQIQIALGQDSAGRLVGLTTKGVYVLDVTRGEMVHTAPAPVPVNCGFALIDDRVYFGSGADLWRYQLPAAMNKER
jgi:outer membrane protein assembly factor BamB